MSISNKVLAEERPMQCPGRSLVSVLSLSSSHLQTVAASGLVWVSPHTKLTLRMSVSGPVMVTAGSYLSGVRV